MMMRYRNAEEHGHTRPSITTPTKHSNTKRRKTTKEIQRLTVQSRCSSSFCFLLLPSSSFFFFLSLFFFLLSSSFFLPGCLCTSSSPFVLCFPYFHLFSSTTQHQRQERRGGKTKRSQLLNHLVVHSLCILSFVVIFSLFFNSHFYVHVHSSFLSLSSFSFDHLIITHSASFLFYHLFAFFDSHLISMIFISFIIIFLFSTHSVSFL